MILLNSVKRGLLFKKSNGFLEKLTFSTKLIVSIMYFISILILPLSKLFFVIIPILTFALLSKKYLELYYFARGLVIIAILSSLFVGLFYSLERTLTVFLRIINIGLLVGILIITTDPEEISIFIEKIGLPSKLAIVIPMSLKLIPLIAHDAEETIYSLHFRNELEMKRFSLKNPIKILTIILASAMWRVRYIAEALASKGALRKRKTYYKDKKISKKDITFLVLNTAFIYILFAFL